VIVAGPRGIATTGRDERRDHERAHRGRKHDVRYDTRSSFLHRLLPLLRCAFPSQPAGRFPAGSVPAERSCNCAN
jgi:hypothetical protein